jgi:hypothetical protein
MARPWVYDRTALMHRHQTWHAGSPERRKLFLYKDIPNPISRKGKILPKKMRYLLGKQRRVDAI